MCHVAPSQKYRTTAWDVCSIDASDVWIELDHSENFIMQIRDKIERSKIKKTTK